MTEASDRLQELAARSLDGGLTADEQAELERALEADPHLRARVSALASVEEELRASFAADLTPPRGRAITPGGPRRQWFAAAAALLAASAVWWFMFGGPAEAEPLDAGLMHQSFVLRPEPSVVCDTPEKFAEYTQEKLGVRIGARFDTPVQLIGWRGVAAASYDDVSASAPRLLLARSGGGQPVVVLFQSASSPDPRLDPRTGLQAFSQRFGDVQAWEITPEPEAHVLQLLGVVR